MNWGTKIIVGMISFMLFIVAMVVYMFSVHGNDALVDEDYYEKGINYNQEYDAKQQVIDDRAQPEIIINGTQLLIRLKDSANYELKLMRPSTVNDDVKKKGSTTGKEHLILIPTTNMHAGLWLMELKWTSNGKKYLFQRNITL